MENNIHLLTSLQTSEKKIEIMKRLQEDEAKKARKLLETAMSHLEAHRIVRNSIIDKLNKLNGNSKIK